jgi:hypothetical protein
VEEVEKWKKWKSGGSGRSQGKWLRQEVKVESGKWKVEKQSGMPASSNATPCDRVGACRAHGSGEDSGEFFGFLEQAGIVFDRGVAQVAQPVGALVGFLKTVPSFD